MIGFTFVGFYPHTFTWLFIHFNQRTLLITKNMVASEGNNGWTVYEGVHHKASEILPRLSHDVAASTPSLFTYITFYFFFPLLPLNRPSKLHYFYTLAFLQRVFNPAPSCILFSGLLIPAATVHQCLHTSPLQVCVCVAANRSAPQRPAVLDGGDEDPPVWLDASARCHSAQTAASAHRVHRREAADQLDVHLPLWLPPGTANNSTFLPAANKHLT